MRPLEDLKFLDEVFNKYYSMRMNKHYASQVVDRPIDPTDEEHKAMIKAAWKDAMLQLKLMNQV